jgi:hypothetical protein
MTDLDKILKSAFTNEKGSELKPGFDKRLLLAIARKKKRAKRVFAIYVSLGAFMILSVSGFLMMAYSAQFSVAIGYLQAIIGFGLMLLLLQVLDKKLVKDRIMNDLQKRD